MSESNFFFEHLFTHYRTTITTLAVFKFMSTLYLHLFDCLVVLGLVLFENAIQTGSILKTELFENYEGGE